MSYLWQIAPKFPENLVDEFPELDPIILQLLYNRQLLTQAQIDEFFHSDYSQDVHDPYLFKDMQKAVDFLYSAIASQELITVYGDYDADGVCAAVILTKTLEKLGANVNAYLPHREKEGYGLNEKAVQELFEQKSKIVITCDCGVSNVTEIAQAKKLGMEVIVTDHHSLPETMPEAYAIIHPQAPGEVYPFRFLAGGGVAFKLAQGLLKDKRCHLPENEREILEKWLLDLVAISTVADMVPLVGENRTLLKYGLVVLRKTRNEGLKQMIEQAGLDPDKIDARTIGFSIAPRINAAGRMNHANLAYYLLKEKDPEKVKQLARDIDGSNKDRQNLTETVIKQAQSQNVNSEDKILFFFQSDWPAGLLGLVASRLMKLYNRPCIVMTENNGNVMGSGRSLKQFNITQVLKDNKELLVRFGGHPQACGFSIKAENLETLKAKLKTAAEANLNSEVLQPIISVDAEITFSSINWQFVDTLLQFQPYGMANEEPILVSRNVRVVLARKVGSEDKHLKLELEQNGKNISAIAFGLAGEEIQNGDQLDIAYNLSINQWNGNREIQIKVKDLKKL